LEHRIIKVTVVTIINNLSAINYRPISWLSTEFIYFALYFYLAQQGVYLIFFRYSISSNFIAWNKD